MTIGEKIKSLRESNELTQMELSSQLNVSSQAVSNWERGKGYPDISNIIQLSELFKVSLDALIKEDLNFKEVLLEDKADRRLDIVLSTVVFILSLGILLFNSYRLITISFDSRTLFGLLVGILGVTDFGKRIYRATSHK